MQADGETRNKTPTGCLIKTLSLRKIISTTFGASKYKNQNRPIEVYFMDLDYLINE
ncbi:hypothetical protein [Colwellia sp. E150_009]